MIDDIRIVVDLVHDPLEAVEWCRRAFNTTQECALNFTQGL